VVAAVDLVNYALRAIGANRITALNEGSKTANAANDIYEMTRDHLLRQHPWNFATMRATLAELGTTPSSGFDHQHGLPSDWVRTISVHSNDAGTDALEYKEETYSGQRVVLSNSSTVYLRYVGRVTDPNLYPPDFQVALSLELAKRLAVAIPNSVSLKTDLDKDAETALLKAKSADAMGQSPEKRPAGSWVSARPGLNSSWFRP